MKRTWFQDVMFPMCFDSREQLNSWHEAMIQSKNTAYNVWVCTDCTPTYQKKMIKENRCENPHVKFRKEHEQKANGEVKDREWSIVGFVSDEDYKKELERRKYFHLRFFNNLKQFDMK